MASSQSATSNNKTMTYIWEIEKFSTLKAQQRSDDFFVTEDRNYLIDLTLHPKEDSDRTAFSEKHLVYMIIRAKPSFEDEIHHELSVHYSLSLLDKNGVKCNTKEGNVKIVNRFIESNWQYIFSRDYVMNKTNGLLIGDTLKVHCEFYMIDNQKSTSPLEISQNKWSTISHDLGNLFESKKYSDVILEAGEKKFAVLKAILSSRSPVFAAMFEHECEEKKQNRVTITDLDGNTLEELLRYIYTEKCSSLEQYSADLMIAADKYQMNALKSICEESLSSNLTTKSALQLWLLADPHSAQQLKTNCLVHITKHCTELNLDQWKLLINTIAPEMSFSLFESVANYAMSNHK